MKRLGLIDVGSIALNDGDHGKSIFRFNVGNRNDDEQRTSFSIAHALLDYFVSEQLQRVGYLNAKRSGRLQVDDEFEFGGLHHRKVGGLRALEDLTGVEADLMPCVRNIDPIGHQSAGFSFVASGIGRGNPMARRKCRSPQ